MFEIVADRKLSSSLAFAASNSAFGSRCWTYVLPRLTVDGLTCRWRVCFIVTGMLASRPWCLLGRQDCIYLYEKLWFWLVVSRKE